MFTGKDFENMGKVAASEYVTSNKDLTETITKIAAHYGLNSAQIARVVEQANVETYLKLDKATDDKYIEFTPADATKIASALNFTIEKDAALIGDYEMIKTSEDYSVLSSFTDDEIERAKQGDAAMLKKAAKGVKKLIDERLEEIDTNFNRQSELLYNNVKQAALETGQFHIVKQAMLQAVSDSATEMIIDAFEFKLKKEGARINFEEVEKQAGLLNKDHPLVKSLIKLSVLKDEYVELRSIKGELEKDAGAVWNVVKSLGGVGMFVGKLGAGVIQGAGKFAVEHPGAVAGGAAAVGIYNIGKAKGRNESSKANVKVNQENVQRATNLKPL